MPMLTDEMWERMSPTEKARCLASINDYIERPKFKIVKVHCKDGVYFRDPNLDRIVRKGRYADAHLAYRDAQPYTWMVIWWMVLLWPITLLAAHHVWRGDRAKA